MLEMRPAFCRISFVVLWSVVAGLLRLHERAQSSTRKR